MNAYKRSLADRLYQFSIISLPLSSDREDVRIAPMLQRMIPMLFLGAVINFLGSLIVQANQARYFTILLAATVICYGGMYLLKRGSARRAALFIIISGWALATVMCITGGGLNSPIFLLFSILSYVAGALLGKHALMQFTILSVFTMLALTILDAKHWLPPSALILSSYSQFFNFSALLTVVWSLQHIFSNAHTEALARARNELATRETMEEALMKSEARLKQSQRVAGIGHYEFDLRTGAWTCSETLNDVFGIGPEYEKNFRSWGKIVLPADRAMMLDHMKNNVLKKRQPLDKEYRIQRRNDGAVRWVRGLGELELDSEGNPVKIFGVIQDITSQKLSEQALAAERESLAVTLRSIGDGVITTDLDGNIVLMNRVAENLTGWMQQEAAGKPLSDVFPIVHEYTHETCANPVEQVLRTKSVHELANHTVLRNRNGHEYVISDSGAPIFDEGNNITGVVLVFRDSTEKTKIAEHMQRTDKLQSIGVLAGGLAHDFNNLLGGLYGYLELALKNIEPETKAYTYIGKALLSFNRMKALTQQLLTFSRGGAPDRKTGALEPVLRESTTFALSGTNILPRFSIPPDLWLCDFDEGQMGQVVDNLVINAQQAMPHVGTVTVEAENTVLGHDNNLHLPAGNYVRVSFTDTGQGIQPVVLQKVFDPFFTTKEKGIGLGLTTVYSIVEKHGGTVTVESIPEKGTTFHVYLPASAQTSCTLEPSESTIRRGAGRILLMDDDEMILEATKGMLEHLGYSVECTRDGKEALAMFRHRGAHHFNAVIMDLTIPGGMGGKEAAGILRRDFPDAIAIVSSGYSNDPVLANPRDYGFTDKIQKPFRLEELSRLLKRYIPDPEQ